MYAPQTQPVPAPIAVRLIGVLDADLVDDFSTLARGLADHDGGILVVDVRDLQVPAEAQMTALAGVVASARAEGRDVRLDARSLHWKRVAKKNLSAQPAVDVKLRSDVRRTVIMARSTTKRKKT
ncbi:MAG: hypothetical protein JO164_03965 [Candidatus Eremiobacteraeota bacterium]|nr:hypothetical protein [Candidatus Eremiobacteraeota bacterium]